MPIDFQPGTTIGGYRVIEQIGHGGMGVVLRARDERLERDVAIKLIRPELLDDTFRARFLAEARAMARVCHPNVLPIYAFGEHEEMPYFVTQLVRGRTVESWLRSRDPKLAPDLETAFKILEGTCRGVAAIHAAQTLHRDLKPSNLLLDADFGVSVADMGVAALLQRAPGEERREIVGTPEYMAPECVMQLELDPELAHRADVYSLGCLAFELLTGAPPFGRRVSMLACMMAHVTEAIPRPSSRRADLGEAVDEVILAALAKDPVERTPSAEAFARALIAARAQTREPVRILVAEDDDDFRAVLGESLRREFPGAFVECVANGRAALDAFDRQAPSVAILDLNMPQIDGMQLTELLRGKISASNVPIVVLTGSGGPREWKHLSELGADGFLVKPVHVKDVTTLLRRVLADRARATPLLPQPMPRGESEEDKETVRQGRRSGVETVAEPVDDGASAKVG